MEAWRDVGMDVGMDGWIDGGMQHLHVAVVEGIACEVSD